MIEVLEAGLVRLFRLAADVDLARGIFADEDDGETRNEIVLGKLGSALGNTPSQSFSRCAAVD